MVRSSASANAIRRTCMYREGRTADSKTGIALLGVRISLAVRLRTKGLALQALAPTEVLPEPEAASTLDEELPLPEERDIQDSCRKISVSVIIRISVSRIPSLSIPAHSEIRKKNE